MISWIQGGSKNLMAWSRSQSALSALFIRWFSSALISSTKTVISSSEGNWGRMLYTCLYSRRLWLSRGKWGENWVWQCSDRILMLFDGTLGSMDNLGMRVCLIFRGQIVSTSWSYWLEQWCCFISVFCGKGSSSGCWHSEVFRTIYILISSGLVFSSMAQRLSSVEA